MTKAIKDLMHEHDAVLFALKVLDAMAGRVERQAAFDAGDARSLLAFLREFADKCHHGKEEGLLFPALEAAGIARSGGPVGVMLDEHEEGRALIARMARASQGGKVDADFAVAAREYASLLRQHIDKENTVLFPMAERVLDASTLEGLYGRFERHEREVIGEGRHEELHRMLDDFEARFLAG